MAKMRGDGARTIYRRKNGCWSAQYEVHTPKGRKRKILYGKTRTEVAAKLAQVLIEAGDKQPAKGRR
jgi:integrase